MSNPTRWALLIGIDKYLPRTVEDRALFHDLRGSVNDVRKVEKYLLSVGTNPANISRLTSSGEGSLPKEDQDIRPTHTNIVNELQTIRGTAKHGDLVYIHYSGHGIRRNKLTQQPDAGDHFTGTALAPMDVMTGGAYLTGYELGVRVRDLVQVKGVRVTIVLDSCYSGKGLRDNEDHLGLTARTVYATDDSMLPSDHAAIQAAEAFSNSHDRTDDDLLSFRSPEIRPSWLEDPVGCVVLSACEADQKAGEWPFDDSGSTGLLTHWLLSNLYRDVTNPPTAAEVTKLITRDIRGMSFRDYVQTPVVHGDSLYEFFGSRLIVQRAACFVSQAGSSNLFRLDIGRAQAVFQGAIYDVFPGSATMDVGTAPTHQLVVVKVDTLNAWAQISCTSPEPSATSMTEGSQAILHKWAFEPAFISSQSLSTSLKSTFQSEMSKLPGVAFDQSADEGLVVYVDSEHLLRVRETRNSTPLPCLPTVHESAADAGERFAYIVSHTLRYQAVLHLRNDPSQVSLPVKFELFDGHGLPIPAEQEGYYKLYEHNEVVASFTNCSMSDSVYLTILCLDSTWAIHRLYPSSGQFSERAFRSQSIDVSLVMKLPDHPQATEKVEYVADTLRACVYVGENPVSWDELLLPELSTLKGEGWHSRTIDAVCEPLNDDLENLRKVEKARGRKEMNRIEQVGQWLFVDLPLRTYARRN